MAWNEGWAAVEALALVAGAVFLAVGAIVKVVRRVVWERSKR